jgi:hypothetical protein
MKRKYNWGSETNRRKFTLCSLSMRKWISFRLESLRREFFLKRVRRTPKSVFYIGSANQICHRLINYVKFNAICVSNAAVYGV